MTLTPVVRTEAFGREVAALLGAPGTRRLDDMLAGLEWVLARQPEAHPKAPGTEFRVAVTQVGEPHLRVFYTYAADRVVLQHAELA